MTAKKYTFENLNSFVIGRFMELPDEERTFCNQVLGLNMTQNLIETSSDKLNIIYNCLEQLVSIQEFIEFTLKSIEKITAKWELMVCRLEESLEEDRRNNPIELDVCRCCIYNTAENLFCLFSNYNTLLDNFNSTIDQQHFQQNLQDPFVVMKNVIDNNMTSLDRLANYIQKLKNLVDFNEVILVKLIVRSQGFGALFNHQM